MYTDYTFPINLQWDEFYYNISNTRILDTNYIKIGNGKFKATEIPV